MKDSEPIAVKIAPEDAARLDVLELRFGRYLRATRAGTASALIDEYTRRPAPPWVAEVVRVVGFVEDAYAASRTGGLNRTDVQRLDALRRVCKRIPYPKADPRLVRVLRAAAEEARKDRLRYWREDVLPAAVLQAMEESGKAQLHRDGRRWIKDGKGRRDWLSPGDDLTFADFGIWLRRAVIARVKADLAPTALRSLPPDDLDGDLSCLTDREHEIVLLLREHARPKIAARLGLAPVTLRKAIGRIKGKLQK